MKTPTLRQASRCGASLGALLLLAGVSAAQDGSLPPTGRTALPAAGDRPAEVAIDAPAGESSSPEAVRGPMLFGPSTPVSVPAPPAAPKKQSPQNTSEVKGLRLIEQQGRGVFYRKGFVLKVGINVIEADLNDPEVRIAAMVSRGGIGTQERFGQMISRARPAAAITGTFFGIHSLHPTGDLVINGRSIFRGFIGTAVAITDGNVVSFIPTRYKDTSVDWSLFDTVIRGGPRLVEAGRVKMIARKEGFRTLPVSVRRTRTAVGLTRDNRLQFVAVRQGITLWELAKVMKAIGAYHAVALDGGTSTAMYFAGRYIAYPGRELTNVMMIYHRKDRYESMRHQFAGPYRPRPVAARPVPPSLPVSTDRGTGSFQPASNLDFPAQPSGEGAEAGMSR